MSTHYDSETVGFHGPIVLLQWADNFGDVNLHHVWVRSVRETLELFERLMDASRLVGFNISFEQFHINQQYNVLRRCTSRQLELPPSIDWYASNEADARDGVCLKPRNPLDLMLVSRKTRYQSLMDRDDIRVRRIPRPLAGLVAQELDRRVPLPDVYFARKKDKTKRWQIAEILDEDGETHPHLVDLKLEFAPNGGLKSLVAHAMGYETTLEYDIPDEWKPKDEKGYAPFYRPDGGDQQWPDVIKHHIDYWLHNERANRYATDDVIYTQDLDLYLAAHVRGLSDDVARDMARRRDTSMGLIDGGDHDSVLAAAVGAIRWKGFAIDAPGLTDLRSRAAREVDQAKHNFNSARVAAAYLSAALSAEEIALHSADGKFGTDKNALKAFSEWKLVEPCPECGGSGCGRCKETGMVDTSTPHPVAARALEIIEYRSAGKEIELFDKLLMAGRFHVSTNVIGALSGRMSGADGLNPQGIKRTKEVRKQFPLKWPGWRLDIGDFSGFEVVITVARYQDPKLQEDLQTKRICAKCAKIPLTDPVMVEARRVLWRPSEPCPPFPIQFTPKPTCEDCKGTGWESGKIHALFGQFLYPPMTYDQIIATNKTEDDKYTASKQGVFAIIYGGNEYTLVNRSGVTEEAATQAMAQWCGRYEVWGQARAKIFADFCSMTQPGGIGTKVVWRDPKEYAETMLGFRRYFTLENAICKALFDLANDVPDNIKVAGRHIRVVRREREQSGSGAVMSALFGAAFGVQAAAMRAAANHEIQGTGAELCKRLEADIWTLQPCGVHEWKILVANIHDEVPAAHCGGEEMSKQILEIIETFLNKYRPLIPLIEIDWGVDVGTWADK